MRCTALTTLFTALLLTKAAAEVEIDLDLTHQRAYLIQDGSVAYESPISSGRASHPTGTGDFKVVEKDLDHRSSMYGKIVDSDGSVINSNADSGTPVPKGARFVQAPMRHFLRFDGAIGMHAGILPGYPASHGCVRMPPGKAALFYNIAEVGTPVHVHGTAPYRSEASGRSRRERERSEIRREPVPMPVPEPAPARRRPFFFRLF